MRILNFLLIGCICFSCNERPENELQVINTQAEKPETHYLSEVFDKTNMVKLETNDSILIRSVQKLIRYKGSIFVSDKQKFLRFNESGQFVNKIGSQGRGPGQYDLINDFTVNQNNDLLYCATILNIFSYDFNGNFINQLTDNIRSTFMYNGLKSFNFIYNGLWSISEIFTIEKTKRMPVYIYRYNEQNQLIDSIKIRSLPMAINVYIMNNPIISDLGSTIFLYYPGLTPEPFLRDTLYEIIDSNLKPVLKLDFSKILITNDITFKEITPENIYNYLTEIRNVTIFNIYRTKRYVFVKYTYYTKPHFFCCDLKQQKGYNMMDGFTDDLFDTNLNVELMPINLEKGEFCFIKNGYEVEGIIDGMDENSNPVVFFLQARE